MIHKHRDKFIALSAETREKNIASARKIVQMVTSAEGDKASKVVCEHLYWLNTTLVNQICVTDEGSMEGHR